MLTLKDSAFARHFQWPSISPGRHNVFCFSPHSLHVYGTRSCPGAAETRFGAPHFPHLASIRVWPCLTVTVFRSNASFTRRSVSSRIACFDISEFPVFCVLGATGRRYPAQGRFWGCNRHRYSTFELKRPCCSRRASVKPDHYPTAGRCCDRGIIRTWQRRIPARRSQAPTHHSILRPFRVRAHHSEIMLGVLVVVLCRDRIAALGFGAGER